MHRQLVLFWCLLTAGMVETMWGQEVTTAVQDTAQALQTDTLREVVVKGQSVYIDAGGYLVSIASLPQVQHLSLTETLAFLSGMRVEDNGLSVFGQGVARVTVDGREVQKTGQELMDYLASFGTRSIQSVRVETHGGASLSGRQMGQAILHITTRRMENGGRLTVTASGQPLGQSHNLAAPTVNVQQRVGPWSLYAVGSYIRSWVTQQCLQENAFTASTLSTTSDAERHMRVQTFSSTLGVGYKLSDSETITLEGSLRQGGSVGHENTCIETQYGTLPPASYTDRMDMDNDDKNWYVGADYVRRWATGQLTALANWRQQNVNDCQDRQRDDAGAPWMNHLSTDSRYTLLLTKVDAKQQLHAKGGTLSGGLSWVKWNNRYDTSSQLTADDKTATTAYGNADERFEYDERTAAAYADWTTTWGRFTPALGLRYELTRLEPVSSLADNPAPVSHHHQLLPTASLSYLLNAEAGHQASLSYARSSELPHMSMLNPAITWESEYSYRTGNPWLNPCHGDRLSAKLTLWRSHSLTLSYRHGESHARVQQKVPDADVYYTSFADGATNHSIGIGLYSTKMFGQTLMLNGGLTYGYGGWHRDGRSVHSHSLMANVQASCQLPWHLRGQLSGFYLSPSRTLTGKMAGLLNLNVSLSRAFLDDKLSVSVSGRYTPDRTDHINTDGVTATMRTKAHRWGVGVTLRYQLDWGNKTIRILQTTSEGKEQLRM